MEILVYIIAGFDVMVLIVSLILISKWRIRFAKQKNNLKNVVMLNSDLRAQRHDFLNHMQVAYGLLELKEYEEASKYLNQLYGQLNKLNNNIRTKKIAVNALLQAKNNEAEEKGVHFFVNITSDLALLEMEEWALCGCIGNLIDNAIVAAIAYSGERCIWVRIYEDMLFYYVDIDNTGVSLTEEETALLFEEGFTTKTEEGHGQGLYIVKKMMKGHGEIKVHSAVQGMIFTLIVKKMTTETG